MNSAIVLWPDNGAKISIEIIIVGPDGKQLIHKVFTRDPMEMCCKTLDRLRMLFGEGKKGKHLTREEIFSSLPQVTLLGEGGHVLELTMLNREAWKIATSLIIGDHYFSISYNVPVVTGIASPSKLFAGFPAVCGSITTLFCTEEDLLFEWCSDTLGVVSRDRVFHPENEHVGLSLLFRCRPRHPLSLWAEVRLRPVQTPVVKSSEMLRWNHTKERADTNDHHAFRVVSYNILHDLFCTSDYAKSQIYPFAKEEVLDLDFRKGVIASEIKAYNSDVVLFQECGKGIYDAYYFHVLSAMGFASKYFNKAGHTREGSVIAFNKKRFESIEFEAWPLNFSTLQKNHFDIASEVEKYPHAKEGLIHMTAVGSLAVLKDKIVPERHLIVGCTHLFYHPHGCHFRSLQAYMLAAAMRGLAEKYASMGKQVHLLLGGDFNFTRLGGAYELLTKGSIPASRDCWDKGLKFWWGCENEFGNEGDQSVTESSAVASIDAPVENHHTRFAPKEVFRSDLSLDGIVFEDTHINEPTLRHTNYTLHFKEIIDHIFIGRLGVVNSESLQLVRTIPLPSDEDLSENVAIPNATYPSDHVALVADLTFI